MDSGAPTPTAAASAEKMTNPEGGSRGAGGADDGAAGSDGRGRPAVQVIDFDGNFSPELKPFLEHSSLIHAGSDYAIVGVIGAQSSGKSTLLNLLFKTPFAVMDASHGRTQTTQGIWASVADSPLLVLDVEGTDSSTRGEDHMTFERKSALLAMALCDVVIVNMWEHDVGRQEASNYTLLRTVFEVNLQLRRSVSKTLLLFTLRDRVSTPLEMLSRRLRDDVQAIWAAAAKPDRWRDAAFADFFDLDFVALPHKVLQPVEFARSVDELRTRFMPVAVGAAADAGLLRPEYRKTVPADGLATYMQQLWEEIIACRDVDIPASRTLLAAFRCDELAAAAQRQMDEAMQSLAEQATRGPVKEFRRRVEEAHAAALASYDALGSRYDHTVYSEKRAALETALWSRAQRVFAEHVRRLAAHATVSVQRELRGVRSLPAERATELVRSQLTAFCQRVQEDRPAAAQWAITPLLLAFAQDLLPHIVDATVGAGEVMQSARASLWSDISARITAALVACALPTALTLLEAGCEAAAVGRLVLRQARQCRQRVVQLARLSTASLAPRIKTRFDELFFYDDRQVPRRWTDRVDIGSIYAHARQQALKLLDALSAVDLPAAPELVERALAASMDSAAAIAASTAAADRVAAAVRSAATPVAADATDAPERSPGAAGAEAETTAAAAVAATDTSAADGDADAAAAAEADAAAAAADDDVDVLLDENKRTELRAQFERDARDALAQAQQMQDAARARNNWGPWWLWLLLLVFGWNEIRDFLTNPVLLIGTLLLLGAWFMGGAQLWAQFGPQALRTVSGLLGGLMQQAMKPKAD